MHSNEEESHFHYVAANSLASTSGSLAFQNQNNTNKIEFWDLVNKYGRIIAYVTFVILFTICFVTWYITLETKEDRKKTKSFNENPDSTQLYLHIKEILSDIEELKTGYQQLKFSVNQ